MDSGFRKSIPSSWDFPFSLVSLTLNSRDTRLRPYCWTWEAASSQSRSGMGLRLGRFLRWTSLAGRRRDAASHLQRLSPAIHMSSLEAALGPLVVCGKAI
jgi:hypothetical protein